MRRSVFGIAVLISFLALLACPSRMAAQNTAQFVRSDTTTLGNWHAIYGADGYSVANDSQSLPSYASFGVQNQYNHTWVSNPPDTKALQTGSGVGRIAAAWYSPSPFTFDVNFTDGNSHQFALYAIDWDEVNRSETIQVFDASTNAVLDTQNLSTFTNGTYLVWNITGHVQITITSTGGPNAVVSGVFFGGGGTITSSANFVSSDTTTEGTWYGVYGVDGFSIANDSQSLPPYASFAVQNQQNYTWAGSTSDARALETGSGSGRIAATWDSTSAFTFDVNFTDGHSHQLTVYAVDWDNQSRAETIQVIDAGTEAQLDSRSISGFGNGIYLAWNISGHVRINVILTSGPSAVVSGVFFGGAGSVSSSATFVGTDAMTEGSWHGVYGADGYAVANDSQSVPAYAAFGLQNQANWTWESSTSDVRALQTGDDSGRIAAGWYNPGSYEIGLNFTDGNSHQVALYALDWDNQGRSETIQIADAATNAVLDTQSVSSFSNGIYLIWNISGHVRITLTTTGGPNAMLSGVFFGGASSNAISISISTPSNGSTVSVPYVNVTGSITDSASSPSLVTCNGSAASLAGSGFTCTVPLFSVSNTVTATGYDALGNTASASINVTVNMPAPTSLQVSPSPATIVIGSTQEFTAIDQTGARRPDVTWSVSDTSVANFVSGSPDTLTGIAAGQVTLTANIGTVSAQATVTVVASGSLQSGTVLWSEPPVSGFTAQKIVEATPTANGPALYSIETDSPSSGDVLIRAFKSDGGKLWQTLMSGILLNADPGDARASDQIFAAVGDNSGGLILIAAPTNIGSGQDVFQELSEVSGNHMWDFDPVTGQQKWQFDTQNSFDNGGNVELAIAPDNTIFVEEGAFALGSGAAYLDAIDGTSGALVSQIQLPVFTLMGDDGGTAIYPVTYGAPIAITDNSIYLETESVTESSSGTDGTLLSLHSNRTGAASYQTLLENGGGFAPGEEIPDGNGGVLASWFVSPDNGDTVDVTVADITSQGTASSVVYVSPFYSNFFTGVFDDLMVLGDNNTAFIKDNNASVTAFDTTTLQSKWTYTSSMGEPLSFTNATSGGGVLINDTQLGAIQLDSSGNSSQVVNQTGNLVQSSWEGQWYALSSSGPSQIELPIPVADTSLWAVPAGNAAGGRAGAILNGVLVQTTLDPPPPPTCPLCNLQSPNCVTISGTQSTYLILVGDPGINTVHPHNVGDLFNLSAQTEANQLQTLGHRVIACRVSSIQQFNSDLTQNGLIDGGVIYFGHAAAAVDQSGLYYPLLAVGQASGTDTNISYLNVSMLSNGQLGPQASITIYACNAGEALPGYQPIAQLISNQLNRGVYAWKEYMYFSQNLNDAHITAAGLPNPPDSLPMYMIPEGGSPKPQPVAFRPH